MPYKNEFAKHSTLSNLIQNDKLQKMLSEMKILNYDKADFEKIDEFIFEPEIEKLKKEKRLKYVFAFDGSKNSVDLKTGFPLAEFGLVRIGHVFVDLQKMIEYQEGRNPNPEDYYKFFRATTIDAGFPGFNVCSNEFKDSKDFFRYTLFSFMKETKNEMLSEIVKEPKTFLESYLDLTKKAGVFSVEHPCEKCANNGVEFGVSSFFSFDSNYLGHKIQCDCKKDSKDLYVTDLLRFHEMFNNGGGNDGLYTQLMNFLEKIMFFNLLQTLVKEFENKKEFFKDVAFILDGPLALYNVNAWVSQAILDYMLGYQKNGYDLLIIGVEKNGGFVEHLKHMDTNVKDSGNLNKGFLFYLNDNYIKKFVKYSLSQAAYGKDTYFGKKLYYKNHLDDLFVINQNYLSSEDKLNFLNRKNDKQYILMQNRLRDIVLIFEKFSSSRYENALSFISLAHESVAIANNKTGQKLIESFIKENLSNGK